MPVTIVATPSTAIPTATTEATGAETAGNDDFANLLQDQLTLSAEQPAAETVATALPTLAASAGDDSDPSQTDGVLDPSALLATLAMVTPQVSNNDAGAASPSSESSNDGTLTAVSASSVDSADIGTQEEVQTSATLARPAATDGEAAAKFAVAGSETATARTQAEAESAKTEQLATDAAGNDTQVSGTDVYTNLHGASARHTVVAETSISVPTPVRDADWSTDLGQKVVWLASSDTQSAQLTLNPEHLGPIDVSVDIDSSSGSASVSFASANAEVRDALESAMPRLREMFASAGIELGQTNVGAESFRQPAGNGEDRGTASRSPVDNAILAGDASSVVHSGVVATQRGNALVDLFA